MPVPGDKYCRLTLLEELGRDGGRVIWKCRCTCGAECSARLDKLKTGRKKSCGCLKDELADAAKKSKEIRDDEGYRISRDASFAKDELRLSTLLRKKGKAIDYRHFELTGSPRQVAKEFREWAFIVAAVLWHGPTDDLVTITADIKVDRPAGE